MNFGDYILYILILKVIREIRVFSLPDLGRQEAGAWMDAPVGNGAAFRAAAFACAPAGIGRLATPGLRFGRAAY